MRLVMNDVKRARAVSVLLVVLSVFHAGCVDLKEVREFAATASAVGDRFPGLARDLYDSCMAQQRYIVAQREDFRVDQFGDLNDSEHPLLESGRKTCKLYQDEQERLIKANATLVSYMKSMGDLVTCPQKSATRIVRGPRFDVGPVCEQS